MNVSKIRGLKIWRAAAMLGATVLAASLGVAGERDRATYVLTSSNDPNGNQVLVFKLDTEGAPALSLVSSLPTGGKGGAGGNGGSLQFKDDLGAVANFGSNSVSRLVRIGGAIYVAGSIPLAPGCTGPNSVALNRDHLYISGASCAESHAWPLGRVEGGVVKLPDSSAGQIAVGRSWAAVTMKSGSVVQLPLSREQGPLSGASNTVNLPAMANDTPLGAAFWGDILGFTPAHSPDSFAVVDPSRNVYPIEGPAPAFPSNAPCWVAKGPGSVWYTGNSPGQAISIFFTDSQGGAYYKSIPAGGVVTDLAVSRDGKFLAAIYTANGTAILSVYSIDAYGSLTQMATSGPVGVATFNGVAFSQ